ncbi:MAG: hypothetical protein ACLQHS_11895 [Candidatus Limnocylindrales bacterium]
MREGSERKSRGRRPDWQPRFLEVMRATGNTRLAADAVAVNRSTPYVRAGRDPAFAAAWAQAREDAIDVLEAEARRRALASSDQLLMFLLRSLRPTVYRDALDVHLEVRREAERMAERLGCTVEEVLAATERKAREVLGP